MLVAVVRRPTVLLEQAPIGQRSATWRLCEREIPGEQG
jgi:hypothetical protein